MQLLTRDEIVNAAVSRVCLKFLSAQDGPNYLTACRSSCTV